jgi:accessory gene regulator B
MRFIHRWSFLCARYLTMQLKENHEKRRVYYFGFQIIIGAMVKGILLVAISLLLGSLIPSLIAVLVFGSFRVLAGGYHMDTYGKCIAISLGLFILTGTFTQYTYTCWQLPYVLTLIAITFFTALYVTKKWVPRDTPNKPITKPEEIKKFRRLSFIYIFIWLIAALALLCFKIGLYEKYLVAGCLGLLLELFAISPIGHKFFDKISGKVDQLQNKKTA